MNDKQSDGLKNTNYEVFILAISILSLVNWVLYFIPLPRNVDNLLLTVNMLLSFIFLVDFLYRLFTTESKKRYFFRQYGWLDLISSLPNPVAKIARLGRIIRTLHLMRELSYRKLFREFIRNRAGSAMLTVLFLIIIVLEFGSLAILSAESHSPDANIQTASDAIWWSIVTFSTVGYGDMFPVTDTGRLVAIVVISIGVGLFGVVTGFMANTLLKPESAAPEHQPATEEDSAAILNEILQLREEQQRANDHLNSRLEELFNRLEQAS